MDRREFTLAAALGLAGTALLALESPAEAGQHDDKERHPAIHAAIRALDDAKADLQKANHDFGGHRANAIKAIEEAKRQLREALKYDKK